LIQVRTHWKPSSLPPWKTTNAPMYASTVM
jgi:hypothetical protein